MAYRLAINASLGIQPYSTSKATCVGASKQYAGGNIESIASSQFGGPARQIGGPWRAKGAESRKLREMTDSRQDLGGQAGRNAPPSMPSSFLDLLNRRDPDAWRQLVRVFYPTIRDWCKRAGLQGEDCEDVAQEVFRALSNGIDRFDQDGGKNSFRGWLYGITKRQLLAHWKRQRTQQTGVGGSDAQLYFAELPEVEGGSDAGDVESERSALLRRALSLMQSSVENRTWQAFWRVAVEGHLPADVAADLGLTVNAVYLIKARMLRRFRDEFGDLLS